MRSSAFAPSVLVQVVFAVLATACPGPAAPPTVPLTTIWSVTPLWMSMFEPPANCSVLPAMTMSVSATGVPATPLTRMEPAPLFVTEVMPGLVNAAGSRSLNATS